MKRFLLILIFTVFGFVAASHAQEWPYLVTYSHDLEEPGNLEVEFKSTAATPKYGNLFFGETVELEYGAKGWWTTEVYLRPLRA